jgi:hypothetical protein
MRRPTRLARILGALCLACSCAVLTTSPSSAATPKWSMHVVDLPDTVSGSGLGYQVTITNPGPSNISQLYLFTGTAQAPAYVDHPAGTTCTTDGGLRCTLGALAPTKSAPATVTVTVAYAQAFTDTGNPGNPEFMANTTGVSSSDGGTSHGDTLTPDNTFKPTVISQNPDFAGGFALDTGAIANNQNLSTGNQQATSVKPPVNHVIATVEDGPGVTFACKKVCVKPFGEWSRVNVDGGSTLSFFPVTLTVPTSVLSVKLNKVQMAHVDDHGVVTILSQCAPGAALENCLQVVQSADGLSVAMTAWVDHNGGFKGMG